jgi:hypothetical protein
MHGNTEVTSRGIKTRRFNKILEEIEKSFRILKENGTLSFTQIDKTSAWTAMIKGIAWSFDKVVFKNNRKRRVGRNCREIGK